jgi:tetratricopeptide (TPR) repeat protein
MTLKLRLICGLLLFVSVLLDARHVNAATTADPDKDPGLPKLLEEARALIDRKQPQAGIDKCEKAIAAFKAHYGTSEHKIYCARSSAETLGYLMLAAADMSKGRFEKGKKDAIVLSGTWASAYYMKGYALQELGRIGDAKSAIKQALALSPQDSQYLSELGSLYVLEKNWPEAMKTFTAAEDNSPISPDETKADDLGRARRGIAYVLVELGKLDEAEKKYEQCLKENPNDTRAATELEYVRGLKAKR